MALIPIREIGQFLQCKPMKSIEYSYAMSKLQTSTFFLRRLSLIKLDRMTLPAQLAISPWVPHHNAFKIKGFIISGTICSMVGTSGVFAAHALKHHWG